MINTRAIGFTILLSLTAAACGTSSTNESDVVAGLAAQTADDDRSLEEKVDTDGDGEMSDEEVAAYAQTVLLEFSQCMRDNGYPDFTDVSLEDLTEGGDGQGAFLALMAERGVSIPEGVPTLQLCGEGLSDLQTFAPEPSDDELAEQEAAVLEFAACMRSEGLSNWPDPDFAANGGNGYGPELLQEFDIQSDEVQSAITTCQTASSSTVKVDNEAVDNEAVDNEAVDNGSVSNQAQGNGIDDEPESAEEIDRAPISPLIEGDTSDLNVAEVARRDLAQTETFEATLGYGESQPFPTNTSGVITGLPGAGDIVGFGEVLFTVDGQSVLLLEGDIPQYRSFDVNMTDGPDVEQLERNLVNLGYADNSNLTVDGNFTDATTQAIEAMQLQLGADAGSGQLRPFPTNTSGVITELPGVGDVIGFGEVLFAVDGQPVLLFEGDIPQYRSFDVNMTDGPDVEQLERSLVNLGYADDYGLTVDDDFTYTTADVIQAMQLELGADETGELDLGRVVFSPTPIRVGAVNVELGQSISPQVNPLSATESTQRITLDLDAGDLLLLPVDTEVDIELPDGTVVPGRVSEVSAVATQAVNQQGAADDPTVEVTIVFADGEPNEVFDAASVDIIVTKEVSAGVLTVPVPALIALSGGGHAVELIVEGGTQLIGVELGDFVDDHVEIRGDIQEGDRVVLAAN